MDYLQLRTQSDISTSLSELGFCCSQGLAPLGHEFNVVSLYRVLSRAYKTKEITIDSQGEY